MSKERDRTKETKPAVIDTSGPVTVSTPPLRPGEIVEVTTDPLISFSLAVQIVGQSWRRLKTVGQLRQVRLSDWLDTLRAVALEKIGQRVKNEGQVLERRQAREANHRSDPTPAT